jgi:hypothetical protein
VCDFGNLLTLVTILLGRIDIKHRNAFVENPIASALLVERLKPTLQLWVTFI